MRWFSGHVGTFIPTSVFYLDSGEALQIAEQQHIRRSIRRSRCSLTVALVRFLGADAHLSSEAWKSVRRKAYLNDCT